MTIKRLIKIVFITLVLMQGSEMWAQQEPLNTMYMYNGISINPAYTGTRDALSLTAMHRQQWVGMDGAPITTNVAVHSPIKFTNMGVGMTLVSDKIGPITDFYANFFYAYRVNFSNKTTLSLGLNFGVYNYNAGLGSLSPDESGSGDAALSSFSQASPNGGTGAYYYGEKFYVGFALPKIFQTTLDDYSRDASNLARHYYLSAGYVFLLNDRLALKPSFLTKVVEGAPITNDINLQLFIDDKFSFGTTYRIKNNVSLMAGYHIANKWMLGYAYGIATSDLSRYNNGSHEVVLTYDFRLVKSVVKSPRYF